MAVPWRRVLVEWPARFVDLWFVDLWFVSYRLLLMALTMVTVSLVLLVWLLALLGIRWGW